MHLRYLPLILLAVYVPTQRCFAAEYLSTAKLVAMPSVKKPGYLQSINDPVFGNAVIRVTDPAGGYSRHHYIHTPPWNANGSLLDISKDDTVSGTDIHAGGANGSGYALLYNRRTSGECKWHPVDPKRQLCLKDSRVYSWDIPANVRSTAFEGTSLGYSALTAGGGQILSDDGNTIASFMKDTAGKNWLVAIDLVAKKQVFKVALATGASHLLVSPSGRYMVIHTSSSYGSQNYIYDRTGQLVQQWREDHRPGHGDLTVDVDGEEIFVGVSKADPDKYQVIKRRLRDGVVTSLTPGKRTFASHVSCRNIRARGWCFVTFSGTYADASSTSRYPFYQECLAISTNGSGEVRRIAHTRSVKSDYEAEAHCTPDFDGSKVIFASNWDVAYGSIAAYVAKWP
jgi:hypothetical protein